MIDVNNKDQLIQVLRNLAANCNNIILVGSFSGENILRAAALCNECHLIVRLLNEGTYECGE